MIFNLALENKHIIFPVKVVKLPKILAMAFFLLQFVK